VKKKILIVEENQEFIDKLSEVKDIFGYPLQIEKSFSNGLVYLKSFDCAAVIQEIVIANQINMDLIKEVRMVQDSKNFEIPIAVMNDSMTPEYAQNMKKKLSGVIHKPFEVSTFVQVVKLIIAIDFLRKLIARLKALEEHEDVIKISGVTDSIKEAVQMIKGFLEEDKEFPTTVCGETIEELLTSVLGEPLPPEASQVIKGLEAEATETFNVLGEKNLEPISKQTVPGVLDLDESVINVGGGLQTEDTSKTVVGGSSEEDKSQTVVSGGEQEDEHSESISGATDHITEGISKISGSGEGNISEETILVKGENTKKAEEIMEEEQNIRGEEKWTYEMRSEIEKLKADILDRQNRDGETYCMLAAGEGDLEEVQRIVEEGADITLRSKDGRNMIHWAARGGNTELVEFFLEKGVDYKFKDNKGNLPVVHAIRTANTEIAKILLDKMKNFRWTNANGQSLVMEAAFAGNDEILKILLDKGAPINLKDNKHRSAFWYAKKKKHKVTMALLIKNGLSA
jgi:CheY-like chemotaxis protein